MTICVIAQPIHPIGIEILLAAGIEVVQVAGASLEALEKVIPSADALIVRDRLPAYCMDLAPRLTVIANHGTGTDKVDVDYATSLGIPVVFTPSANVRSVAEHALMLMLATGRHAVLADTAARQGNWAFKYEQPMQSLYGKTLGVVGLGHTGRLVCEMASVGLGMKVIVWSPSLPTDTYLPVGVERASCLKDLLQISDVVSLHRPLRQDTFHMLNRETLQQMKRGAIVINTSRGALIDEVALVEALRSGHLFGAGLDVFEQEPLLPDSLLSGIQNVILTPHIAGSSQDALKATASQCAQQIVRVLSGDLPENLVQPGVWENRRRPVCIS